MSALPTSELQADELVAPTCEYSVRSGSLNGPTLSFANVGETVRFGNDATVPPPQSRATQEPKLQVFHVWECKGTSMGMLIKNCYVTDGDGDEHEVVGDLGQV